MYKLSRNCLTPELLPVPCGNVSILDEIAERPFSD